MLPAWSVGKVILVHSGTAYERSAPIPRQRTSAFCLYNYMRDKGLRAGVTLRARAEYAAGLRFPSLYVWLWQQAKLQTDKTKKKEERMRMRNVKEKHSLQRPIWSDQSQMSSRNCSDSSGPHSLRMPFSGHPFSVCFARWRRGGMLSWLADRRNNLSRVSTGARAVLLHFKVVHCLRDTWCF